MLFSKFRFHRKKSLIKEPDIEAEEIRMANIDSSDNDPIKLSVDSTLSFEIKDGVLIKYLGKDSDAIIPDSVISIGNFAFEGCISLNNIHIPNNITDIGWGTFKGCTGLTNIAIPDNVTSIGESAFAGCISLTNITIPNGVTSIGSSAFRGCSCLKSITIPDSLTSIGCLTFKGCTGLTNIAIPNSVTSIGNSAFEDCAGLINISIGNSVKDIDNLAFSNCTKVNSINVADSNIAYCSIDGVLFNKSKTKLIYYPQGKNSVSYSVPDSVTNIDRRAFENCTELTSIIISDGVKSIDDFAFKGCVNLISITIPDSVTRIGAWAFKDCLSLKNVHYSGELDPRVFSNTPFFASLNGFEKYGIFFDNSGIMHLPFFYYGHEFFRWDQNNGWFRCTNKNSSYQIIKQITVSDFTNMIFIIIDESTDENALGILKESLNERKINYKIFSFISCDFNPAYYNLDICNNTQDFLCIDNLQIIWYEIQEKQHYMTKIIVKPIFDNFPEISLNTDICE